MKALRRFIRLHNKAYREYMHYTLMYEAKSEYVQKNRTEPIESSQNKKYSKLSQFIFKHFIQ